MSITETRNRKQKRTMMPKMLINSNDSFKITLKMIGTSYSCITKLKVKLKLALNISNTNFQNFKTSD